MPEIKGDIKDPRQVEGYQIEIISINLMKITVLNVFGFKVSFIYDSNPTGNCQLASAVKICNILPALDKHKFRDLLIKIRKEYFRKNMLMLDLNVHHLEKIKSWLSPKTIISEVKYTSTNGSKMAILILRLSTVRQLQIPK